MKASNQQHEVVIEAMHECGMGFVGASFEADAKQVGMEKDCMIDGIITSASDLIALGAQRVFLLDPKAGARYVDNAGKPIKCFYYSSQALASSCGCLAE